MKLKFILTATVASIAVATFTGCSDSNKTAPDANPTNTVATMATNATEVVSNAAVATGSMVTNAVDSAASAATNGAAQLMGK